MRPMDPEKKIDGFVTLGGPPPGARCPRFRPAALERLYPVTRYCVVRARPGCLMVPCAADYRLYCCSGQFDACPWYRGDPGEDGS
jgi:hypothetical protein